MQIILHPLPLSAKELTMMAKEEVASIVLYCKEHNVSFKYRLEELGIVLWRFYEAKCRYGKDKSNGLLEIAYQRTFIPCPDLNRYTKRPTDCSTDSGNVSIKLQTSTGVIMRIQGCLDSAQLQSIIEWIIGILTKLPLYRDTSKGLCELLPMNWKNNSNS